MSETQRKAGERWPGREDVGADNQGWPRLGDLLEMCERQMQDGLGHQGGSIDAAYALLMARRLARREGRILGDKDYETLVRMEGMWKEHVMAETGEVRTTDIDDEALILEAYQI